MHVILLSRREASGFFAIVLLLLALSGCSRESTPSTAIAPSPGAPIILISIDTLRSDHLPAYGYTGVATPAIDALRQDGILFERAYSHYPLTLPSHTSVLTGLLPTEHGVRDNMGYQLDSERLPYLPRSLRDHGYQTGGFVSAFVLRGSTGLATGFDVYADRFDMSSDVGMQGLQRSGHETLGLALDWLRGSDLSRPLFLFLHLFEPHTPYEPQEPFASRYESAYDGEIAAADDVLGKLIEELKKSGLYDRALIALISDHGEGLGDHEELEHGVLLYREVLQVPLILKLPNGARAGSTVSTPAQLVDFFPTVLAVIGEEGDERLQGQNLIELPEGGEQRAIYSETYFPYLHMGWSGLTSVIEDGFHYIQGPDPELYDLNQDPGELVNALRDERAVLAGLREKLSQLERPLKQPDEVDPETVERLEALGYIGSHTTPSEGGTALDPKANIHVFVDLSQAMTHIKEERYAAAIAVLEGLVAKNPRMHDGWIALGLAQNRLGHLPEAAHAYREALGVTNAPNIALELSAIYVKLGELGPADAAARLALSTYPAPAHLRLAQIAMKRRDFKSAEAFSRQAAEEAPTSWTFRQLGLILARIGQPQEAIAILEPLVEKGGDKEIRHALAVAYSETGKQPKAIAMLRRILELDANDARAYQNLGMATLRMGPDRAREADSLLRRALEIDPKLPIAWNTLGVTSSHLGKPEEAIAAWQTAVRLDPGQVDALFNLGLTAARLGRRDIAREALLLYLERSRDANGKAQAPASSRHSRRIGSSQ